VRAPGMDRLVPATRYAAKCVLLWVAMSAACAAAVDYQTGPPPRWVDVLEPELDAPMPTGTVSGGTEYLLLDRQVEVRERGHGEFEHLAVRVVSAAGIERNSQIDLHFDPAYQRLTLHRVNLHRDGQVIDQMGRARVTVLPIEQDLQARIYNGMQLVNLLLSDLRVGDVLEYAYSVDSANPLFPKHYYARMDTGWSDPIRTQRIRVLHPSDRPLRYRSEGASADPQVREHDGVRELTFSWRDPAPIPGESDVPDWYTLWPYLEFSDLEGWQSVQQMLSPLYRVPARGPLFDEWVLALRAVEGGKAAQVLAALRRVQQDIAYTSISIGEGSHRPAAPEQVLERRFGDCKDKSVLLSALLGELDVDARVAFVHSSRGRQLPDSLPSPFAFNHAIVRVELDGQVYWLDPTRGWQGGDLRTLAQADFEQALVLGEKRGTLEAMPRSAPDKHGRHVRMTFDLTAGIDQPAALEVSSTLTGLAADSMRQSLASRDAGGRAADYHNYYARLYPGLESAGLPEVTDDIDENVIRIRERYRMPSGFQSDDTGLQVFEILPDELYGLAELPATLVRSAPLGLTYPAHVSQVIEVRLPEPWPVELDRVSIDNDAFRYQSELRGDRNTVIARFEYQALTDHVASAGLSTALDDLRRMSEDLAYELNYRKPGSLLSTGIAAGPALVALLSVALSIWLGRRLYRFDPPPYGSAPTPGAPVGIRGWLLVPALSLAIMAGSLLVIVGSFATYLTAGAWAGLPDIVPENWSAAARPMMLCSLAVAIVLFGLTVSTAIAFSRHRTSAVLSWIALAWSVLVFGIAIGWVAGVLFGETAVERFEAEADSVQGLVSTALWTAYMLRSKRVRATFTRRYSVSANVLQAGTAASGSPVADSPG